MGLRIIKNNSTLKVVHNNKDASVHNTLSVVHKRVDKPVIQLMTY